MQTDPNLLRILFDAAPEGVMVCDAHANDMPVVYANRAMEHLTGYPVDEILGRNPRFLYGPDKGQEALGRLRSAISEGAGCHVVIRNQRPDGTVFFNDVTLVPLRDAAGNLTHFASFHREGAGQLKPDAPQGDTALSTQTMLAYVRDDKLTGLLRRSYFEDLLQRDWGLAQRESRRLTLIAFDLDFFEQYRDVFGRQGADQCFRRIARVIAGCFRRSTDMCGRLDEDQVIALTVGMEDADANRFAESILGRVRDLAIHHPRSSVSRYVTVSAGIATMVPGPDSNKDQLIGAVLGAMRRAKDLGRNRVVSATLEK
jgi:diguanylate cyclase (GGDEF)-like protein/PAS domain S-box-containing protein